MPALPTAITVPPTEHLHKHSIIQYCAYIFVTSAGYFVFQIVNNNCWDLVS